MVDDSAKVTQPKKGWNQEDKNPSSLAPIPLNYKVRVVRGLTPK